MSIVEAVTVTGPVKPLLTFSSLVRSGFHGRPPVRHFLMSTRRGNLGNSNDDPLCIAAGKADVSFLPIRERGRFDTGVVVRFREAIAEARPDIVETHDFKSHFLFYLLRRRYPELRGCKWLAYHHGYTRTSWQIRLYQQLDRITLRDADHVVTLCQPFAKDLIRRGVNPSNLSTIANFAAPRPSLSKSGIGAARAKFGIDIEECVILSIGRLSREKGHADLLAAFRQMLAQRTSPKLRLVLVGDGPERSRLETLARPLSERVIFTGHLDDPWSLLNAADIFTLPSHSEGSPLVLFEAMSARCPIVASAVGSIPEILTHGESAILVPRRSPSALAVGLLTLTDNPELRTRLSATAASVLSDYTPERHASRLLQIYDALLVKRSS